MQPEPNAYQWNKVAGVVGLLSMAFLIAGLITEPNKPISSSSAISAIVANVSSHPHMQVIATSLNIFAVILFLGYAAISARRTRSAQHDAPWAPWMMAAATAFAVFAVMDAVLTTAMAFAAQQGSLSAEPELTRVLYDLYDGILMPGAAHLALAGYLALVAVQAFAGRIGPRWAGWAAAVFAALALVNGFVGLTVSSGGSFPLAPVAVAGFILVTIVGSISMLRERQAATGMEAQPARAAAVR